MPRRFIFKARSLLLSTRVHVPQNYHLTRWAVELPPTKYEDMGAYRSCSVAIATQRRLALEPPFLPDQLILCVQYYEVVDVCWRNKVLFPSRP